MYIDITNLTLGIALMLLCGILMLMNYRINKQEKKIATLSTVVFDALQAISNLAGSQKDMVNSITSAIEKAVEEEKKAKSNESDNKGVESSST